MNQEPVVSRALQGQIMASTSNFSTILAFLHTIVIVVWVILGTFVLSIVAILTSFFSKTGDSVHRVARFWGRTILWISGITVHMHGTTHLESGRSVILMSNHQSNFDIPVFLSELPVQFRWLAKAELFRIPIFGRGMAGAGYISIDRSNRKAAMESLERAARTIRDGASVLIFPEGTRSEDGLLRPFKAGGFILAVDAGVPIQPIAIHGTFEVMPKGSWLIRRRSVHIAFGPAIDAADFSRQTKNQLMDAVRQAIAQAMQTASQGGGLG